MTDTADTKTDSRAVVLKVARTISSKVHAFTWTLANATIMSNPTPKVSSVGPTTIEATWKGRASGSTAALTFLVHNTDPAATV